MGVAVPVPNKSFAGIPMREPMAQATRLVGVRKATEPAMLEWTLIFLVIAVVAAVFGFSGVAATSAGIARVLFGVFLILFIASFVIQMIGPA